MIPQAYVQAGDRTAPSIQTVRARISQAVGTTPGTAVERLKVWLQMPTDATFKDMIDNNCKPRAEKLGEWLSPGDKGLLKPSLASKVGLEGRWSALARGLEADRAVLVDGAANHVGGPESKFRNDEGRGFHVILFLANGLEQPSGREYFLGFDPDVSATTEARNAWLSLGIGTTLVDAQNFDAVRTDQVINTMILGDGQDVFGPLVRKYYVDRTAVFPPVKRV
ncbi:hypothetical protein ACFCX4_35250 [Kitasatospora sp. NPDC056327]|uniref:hypothetical protein n=1 Tax=Kitasatospora sp. NPDC056327 TaxID=3345785 RepID=UPI0035D6ABA8